MERDKWDDIVWNEEMAKRAIKKACGKDLYAENAACWVFIGDNERAEFRFRNEGVSMSWNAKHTFLEYADIADLFGYEAEDVADEEANPSSLEEE